MSAYTRALILGTAGPAIQAIGIAWEVVHILLGHLERPLQARHLAFEPAMLVIFVGFLISVVCIPVAVEVARATREELMLPILGLEEEDRPDYRRAEELHEWRSQLVTAPGCRAVYLVALCQCKQSDITNE